ncbi:MAG: DUF421 domain-containing protein [Burkholderiales bacterium]|nr:DUF421 domain-containing protein [Burkholderiales bacterium]
MVDWARLVVIDVPVIELVLRGTAIYWFLFLIFRFVLRRDTGSIALADILLLVLIADGAQNAMAGGYESVSSGIVLVSTIVGWTYLVDWCAFRSPVLRRWLEPPPLPLVRNGRVLRANMRREMVTMDELSAQMRQQGVEQVADIGLAVMESDGTVSIVPVARRRTARPSKRARRSTAV